MKIHFLLNVLNNLYCLFFGNWILAFCFTPLNFREAGTYLTREFFLIGFCFRRCFIVITIPKNIPSSLGYLPMLEL